MSENNAVHDPDLITTEELIAALGVSPDVLERYSDSRRVPSRPKLYRKSEIEKCCRETARRERIEAAKMTPEERRAYLEQRGWSPREDVEEGGLQ